VSISKEAEAKTPEEYIDRLDEPRRSQVERVHDLIRRTVPQLEPHIRSGMIGYGAYHYRYASGREGDWFVVGLASNKRSISLYVVASETGGYVAERYKSRLPKADIGKSCIRVNRIEDLDRDVLAELITEGVRVMKSQGHI
jgi:hypothetical protein